MRFPLPGDPKLIERKGVILTESEARQKEEEKAARAKKIAKEKIEQAEQQKAKMAKQAEKHFKVAASKVELAKKFLEIGDEEKAKKSLAEVITKYGDTPSAKDAEALLKTIK